MIKRTYSAPGSTSSSLIVRVLTHDQDAWNDLVQVYGFLVYRWARQNGLQDSDAVDIVQDVFQGVVQSIEQFAGQCQPGNSFRAWLYGITRHKLIDHFRKQARSPMAVGGTDAQRRLEELSQESADTYSSSTGPDEKALLVERIQQLLREEFSESTWQAFWRMVVFHQDTHTIAQELRLSKSAVTQAKYRVSLRLRQLLIDES